MNHILRLRHPLVLLFFTMLVACCFVQADDTVNTESPPATFRDADLAGTWEGHYGFPWGTDQLTLRKDGTFKQFSKDEKGYIYETPWNRWWTERFSDGRLRLHLEGARYFLDGIEIAEQEGLRPAYIGGPQTRDFYDQFAKDQEQWVQMKQKLVVNVRRTQFHDIILVHMSGSSDVPTHKKLTRITPAESP